MIPLLVRVTPPCATWTQGGQLETQVCAWVRFVGCPCSLSLSLSPMAQQQQQLLALGAFPDQDQAGLWGAGRVEVEVGAQVLNVHMAS